jgi:hypothetical protein
MSGFFFSRHFCVASGAGIGCLVNIFHPLEECNRSPMGTFVQWIGMLRKAAEMA